MVGSLPIAPWSVEGATSAIRQMRNLLFANLVTGMAPVHLAPGLPPTWRCFGIVSWRLDITDM